VKTRSAFHRKREKNLKKKEESDQALQEQYLQAKLKGDTKLIKMLEAIMKRLGIKIPRI
jgi:hypothetical protein